MANNTEQLSKIISIFRDISVRHKQINDFGYGQKFDIGASRSMLFPYLWVEPTRHTWNQTDNRFRDVTYTFNVYIMDKINKGDSNWEDTHSDTEYILSTILTEISQHQYYVEMGIIMDGDVDIEPEMEETDDNSNGWKANLSLRIPMRYTPCNIPIQPITGFTVSLNSSITEYRLIGSTGPQGPTGPQGVQGSGTTGSNGVTGATGPQGFQGNIGPQGFQGNQGLQGPTGPQGLQGFQGNQGPQGNTGSQGITGSQGPQGFQGVTGSGTQGPQGPTGPISLTGSQYEVLYFDQNGDVTSDIFFQRTGTGSGTALVTLSQDNFQGLYIGATGPFFGATQASLYHSDGGQANICIVGDLRDIGLDATFSALFGYANFDADPDNKTAIMLIQPEGINIFSSDDISQFQGSLQALTYSVNVSITDNIDSNWGFIARDPQDGSSPFTAWISGTYGHRFPITEGNIGDVMTLTNEGVIDFAPVPAGPTGPSEFITATATNGTPSPFIIEVIDVTPYTAFYITSEWIAKEAGPTLSGVYSSQLFASYINQGGTLSQIGDSNRYQTSTMNDFGGGSYSIAGAGTAIHLVGYNGTNPIDWKVVYRIKILY